MSLSKKIRCREGLVIGLFVTLVTTAITELRWVIDWFNNKVFPETPQEYTRLISFGIIVGMQVVILWFLMSKQNKETKK